MLVSRSTRLLGALLGAALCGCPPAQNAQGTACSPSSLPGVDTSDLTAREQCEWAHDVSELLAPCSEVAVSLAECVARQRACAACLPAARFLLKQVRSGKPKEQVIDLYELRFDPGRVKTIVIGDSPVLGPTDAPVTIVEFADFECPSCAAMNKLLRVLEERFSGKLRLVFKHFPISYHPFADPAARASIAAQAQGKFWQLYPILFDRQKDLTNGDLERYATEIGLDLERFRRDMASADVKQRIELDKRQGTGLGVRATPTLFINGREVAPGSLDQPLDDLAAWIELEIELVSRGAVPAAPPASPGGSGAPAPPPPAVAPSAFSGAQPAAPNLPPPEVQP